MREDLPLGMELHGDHYTIRRTIDGKRRRVKLGRDLETALREYHAIHGGQDNRMTGVIKRYRKQELPKKAPKTQKEYGRQLDTLDRVFGLMYPHEIRKHHAVDYMDRFGTVAANREIALLRALLTKCCHWGLLESNPLMQLQYRVEEKPRDRIVTQDDLLFVMRRAPARLRYLIWIAYLTGLRRGDLLRLTLFDFSDNPINEGKTGKRVRLQWTPSLRKVVRRLKALNKPGESRLFPFSDSGCDSAWQRLRQALKTEGYDLWQIKDLRAMHAGEVDDMGGDATHQLGHSDPATTRRHYLRKGRKVVPIR